MTTLTELREQCAGRFGKSPEYVAKQLHALPPVRELDRTQFLLENCKGKVVLDIGASGPMHEAICEAAKFCYGIDREVRKGVVSLDLDDCVAALPVYDDVEIVVCGEVLEHLSNPGQFLDKLAAAYKCRLIFTVPNAFYNASQYWVWKRQTECVNSDHVAWYSPKTLKTLLGRAGLEVSEWASYHGDGWLAEGIIAVVERRE